MESDAILVWSSSNSHSAVLEFLDLNDDCIESIFGCCSLAALCSLSLTCTRIFMLGNSHFNRKYTKHRMEISDELAGPTVLGSENYIKCFGSNVRNIRISSKYKRSNCMRLFRFLRDNCCNNLKELEFDSVCLSNRTEKYGVLIKSQLNTVTTVSFINCSGYDIYNSFLKYCNQLKHLIVKEETFTSELNCTWMVQAYSHLESLVFHNPSSLGRSFVPPEMLLFIQLNSQIKNIAISNMVILLHIVQSQLNMNLDYLVLRIENDNPIDDTVRILKDLCESGRLRRVKLDFEFSMVFEPFMVETLNSFGTFQQFDGLSFAIRESTHDCLINGTFNHVKSLSLEISTSLNAGHLHRLTSTVPNLEEICLNPWSADLLDHLDHYIINLLALKKLKTIVIHRINPNVTTQLLITIESCFKCNLFESSTTLTIYLPYEIVQTCKFINSNRVRIQPISSYDQDIFKFDRCAI